MRDRRTHAHHAAGNAPAARGRSRARPRPRGRGAPAGRRSEPARPCRDHHRGCDDLPVGGRVRLRLVEPWFFPSSTREAALASMLANLPAGGVVRAPSSATTTASPRSRSARRLVFTRWTASCSILGGCRSALRSVAGGVRGSRVHRCDDCAWRYRNRRLRAGAVAVAEGHPGLINSYTSSSQNRRGRPSPALVGGVSARTGLDVPDEDAGG